MASQTLKHKTVEITIKWLLNYAYGTEIEWIYESRAYRT